MKNGGTALSRNGQTFSTSHYAHLNIYIKKKHFSTHLQLIVYRSDLLLFKCIIPEKHMSEQSFLLLKFKFS